MDIEFEKDGIVKTTHKKFTEDLAAVGWKVKEKPKPVVKKAKAPTAKDQFR